MPTKYKKAVAAVAGLAIVTAIAAPLVMPGTAAAAKWFSWTQVVKTEATTGGESIGQDNETAAQPAIPAVTEAVISTNSGAVERVQIIEAGAKPALVVAVDTQAAAKAQEQANKGQADWLLNPLEVVKRSADKYGFSAKDSFTLISQVYKGPSGTGEAYVLVGHDGKYYRVRLTQPGGPGADKIWAVAGIEEVKVIKTSSAKRPDVGPGVEGLDYDKVIKWQQKVDEGRELWRLDPLKVARAEGKNYGFTDSDTFTLVKRYASTSIARHGQIDIEVVHNGKKYTMILVRPFGSDDGAIWTVYAVSGVNMPPAEQPDTAKVFYETGKFDGWKWYKGRYPDDMAFAIIVDYAAQLKYDERIPEFVLDKVKNIDYSQKAVLFAYLGTAPSGGYGIGIKKVSQLGNNITVEVQTLSPRPGQAVTLAVTHPADYVAIDRNLVDIWGGVTVTFVDQYGKVLSKNKVTVSHR